MKKASPHYVLKSGRVISDRELEVMSEKIEHEQFDLSQIKRIRGRPRLGKDPSIIDPIQVKLVVKSFDLR